MENQTQQVQPQPEQKKKWYKKWWGIVTIMVFSLFVLIIIIPADSENEEVGKNEKKQEEQATITDQLTQNQENKTEEAKKEDIIKLKITQPEGESIEVTQDTFNIEGSVASPDVIVEINKENSDKKNEVVNVDSDGNFGSTVDLQKGSNRFEIVAKKDGEEAKKSLVILRKMTTEEIDAELKAEAKTIPYKDLFRNIDKHKEEKIHYTGKVIQVIGDGKFLSTMRVDITKGAYGIWDDTVLVTNLDIDADKILEDDIIEFWGIVMGEESYETVMGATVSLPSVSASIIELVK